MGAPENRKPIFELGVARKKSGAPDTAESNLGNSIGPARYFAKGMPRVLTALTGARPNGRGGRGGGVQSRWGAGLRGLAGRVAPRGAFRGARGGIDDPSGGPERGPAGAGAVRLAQTMRRTPVRFNGAPGAALSRARVAPPLGALSELSRGPSRGLWRAPRARPGALRGAAQGVGFLRPPSDEPLKGSYDGLAELYQGLRSASPSPPLGLDVGHATIS